MSGSSCGWSSNIIMLNSLLFIGRFLLLTNVHLQIYYYAYSGKSTFQLCGTEKPVLRDPPLLRDHFKI
jgi:hypothetical protein